MTAPRLLVLVLPCLLLPAMAAHGTPEHHDEHVLDVHYPDAVERGTKVLVNAMIRDPANVTQVRLIYCRVQAYACGPVLTMTPDAGPNRSATIPWSARFFDPATHVGIRLQLALANGTITHSPKEHYPARPASLPEGADTYYYYSLAAKSPWASALLVLVALAIAGRLRR